MRPTNHWLFLVLLAFVVISCQEDVFKTPDSIDEDMITATSLAEEYLTNTRGRFEDSERSITVLKYQDGKLLFSTNTDDVRGYQEVVETSITAIVEPGEFIFWFSGGGLKEVEAIEFDGASQEILEDLPNDFVPEKMWVVQVPDSVQAGEVSLKYDIVYEPRGGIQVRLDPKIQIQN